MAQESKLRIISHPLCPYAHRAVLLLMVRGLERGRDFEVVYVDLAAREPWFTDASIGGRMPVLQVDGRTVAVHAGPMFEFLDDCFARPAVQGVLPQALVDPARERLREREGVAHIDAALVALKGVFTATSTDALDGATRILFVQLAQLESRFDSGEFSDQSANTMSAFEIAAAPFFSLAMFFSWLREQAGWRTLPHLRELGQRLQADPMVRASRCPDYRAEFTHFFSLFSSEFHRQFA